jgi:hypothetical protein
MNGINMIHLPADPKRKDVWTCTAPHDHYPYLAVCQEKPNGDTTATYSFVISVVQEALQWLKQNNPLYQDVNIEGTLRQLYARTI